MRLSRMRVTTVKKGYWFHLTRATCIICSPTNNNYTVWYDCHCTFFVGACQSSHKLRIYIMSQCLVISFRFVFWPSLPFLSPLSHLIKCPFRLVKFFFLTFRMFIDSFVLALCNAEAIWCVYEGLLYFSVLLPCLRIVFIPVKRLSYQYDLALLTAILFCLHRVMVHSLHALVVNFLFFLFHEGSTENAISLSSHVRIFIYILHLEYALFHFFFHTPPALLIETNKMAAKIEWMNCVARCVNQLN